MPLEYVDDGDGDKHAGPLPKFSIFSFIINSNKAFKDRAEKDAYERKFKRWCDRVFSDMNVAHNVLLDLNDKEKNIEQIDTIVSKEIGSKKHMLHVNVVIRVRHHNRLVIDKEYLQEVWRKESGLQGVYIETPHSAYDRAAYLVWYAQNKRPKNVTE